MKLPKFSEWYQKRIVEMDTMTNNDTNSDPQAKVRAAQKAALASKKHGLDLSAMAKNEKLKKDKQDVVMADPELGPEVAAQIFKDL